MCNTPTKSAERLFRIAFQTCGQFIELLNWFDFLRLAEITVSWTCFPDGLHDDCGDPKSLNLSDA
jgi:hypothetical protein